MEKHLDRLDLVFWEYYFLKQKDKILLFMYKMLT